MTESESVALPLGDTPILIYQAILADFEISRKRFYRGFPKKFFRAPSSAPANSPSSLPARCAPRPFPSAPDEKFFRRPPSPGRAEVKTGGEAPYRAEEVKTGGEAPYRAEAEAIRRVQVKAGGEAPYRAEAEAVRRVQVKAGSEAPYRAEVETERRAEAEAIRRASGALYRASPFAGRGALPGCSLCRAGRFTGPLPLPGGARTDCRTDMQRRGFFAKPRAGG